MVEVVRVGVPQGGGLWGAVESDLSGVLMNGCTGFWGFFSFFFCFFILQAPGLFSCSLLSPWSKLNNAMGIKD